MTEREAIKNLNYLISEDCSDTQMDYVDEIKMGIKALEKQAMAKHSKILKWQKCTRKNGTEFLKLIYYSPYVQGYVELGRFNMTKYEIQNNDWNLDGILKELE